MCHHFEFSNNEECGESLDSEFELCGECGDSSNSNNLNLANKGNGV